VLALSRQGDPHTELAPRRKLALYLAEPVGESSGIGERSPEVIDPGVEAILDPHDALAIDRIETPQNRCVATQLDPPPLAPSLAHDEAKRSAAAPTVK
jgi:hypothetical protein